MPSEIGAARRAETELEEREAPPAHAARHLRRDDASAEAASGTAHERDDGQREIVREQEHAPACLVTLRGEDRAFLHWLTFVDEA